MDKLEYRILAKRRSLECILVYALEQAPVYLPIVKQLKEEIGFCELALKQLYVKRTSVA